MLHTDIDTWFANVEQHASDGVDKILVGNKSDWEDKRAVMSDAGEQKAKELGVDFIETSAKENREVENAFFKLARSVALCDLLCLLCKLTITIRAIKTRLIDSQPDASSTIGSPSGGVKVDQSTAGEQRGCCT